MKWLIASALALAAAVIITRQRMAEEEAQAAQTGPDPAAPPEPAPLFSLPEFSFPEVSMPSIDWPAWTGIAPSVDESPSQLNTPLESVIVNTQQFAGNFFSGIPSPSADAVAANRRAFLDMIGVYAEGADYNVMFGGGTFNSYADHPRQAFQFTNGRGETLWTTAAGKYQFMAVSELPNGKFTKSNTWDVLKARLNLPDFSPASQDQAALELIREKGALADVDAGRVTAAIKKVAGVWASLPGAGYSQPEKKLNNLLAYYTQAGGTLEA